MAKFATTTTQPNRHPDPKGLDPSQKGIRRILKGNEEKLDKPTRNLLESYDRRYDMHGCSERTNRRRRKLTVDKLPSQVDEEEYAVKIKNEDETDYPGDEETPALTGGGDSSTRDLPPKTYLLVAPLHVPTDVTGSDLMRMVSLRSEKPHEYKEIFDEIVAPPYPIIQKKAKEPLFRDTPVIYVKSRREARSVKLHRYVEAQPIVRIRGLDVHLKMDLSKFSTKTLSEKYPNHDVEVRTQLKLHPDINVNKKGATTWKCESKESYSTIGLHAEYLASTFEAYVKEDSEKLEMEGSEYEGGTAKRRKVDLKKMSPAGLKKIEFGTNIDFSNKEQFKAELNELAKLPPFCRITDDCNLLTHLGHDIYGMNTAQGYMKIPGNRTPVHMENDCLASVNINIGPGDCEWFAVPHEYWGNINKECRKRKLDFLRHSWWPNMDELMSKGIPVYRFTQRVGDLVYVGPGCVHWVQSTGWCNNIAWNVAPITYKQLSIAAVQYEYNRFAKYHSLVPLQNLFWRMAEKVQVVDRKVYSFVRGMLIRSFCYCKMVADYAVKKGLEIEDHPREEGDLSHYCTACKIEVFNVLFCLKQTDEETDEETDEQTGKKTDKKTGKKTAKKTDKKTGKKTAKRSGKKTGKKPGKENGKQQSDEQKSDKFAVYCVDCAIKIEDYHVLQEIPFPKLMKIFDDFQLHTI